VQESWFFLLIFPAAFFVLDAAAARAGIVAADLGFGSRDFAENRAITWE